MTRAEIRNMARKRLGETIGAFWSNDELNSWINEAGEDCAFKSKSIRTNAYFTTTSAQEYVLSTVAPNIYSVLDVYYKVNGVTWKKLQPISSRQDMDLQYQGWMNAEAAAPYAYYYDREEDVLLLHPKADATNQGTDYARVYYARTFIPLTNDNSSPNLPEPLHLAMVDWVVSLGYETRGYGDKANDAMTKYEAKIQAYKVERHREKEDDEIIMRSYRNGRGF
jgi:hypothetical protein